jgi:hypothetical protein
MERVSPDGYLRMHAAPGDEHVGARADIPPLPVQEDAQRPFEDVQRLVGVFMAVQHGDVVVSFVPLQDSQPPAGLLGAGQHADAVAEANRRPRLFLGEGQHHPPRFRAAGRGRGARSRRQFRHIPPEGFFG